MSQVMPIDLPLFSFISRNSYLLSTILSFGLVMALTPFTRKLSLKYNQVDLPAYRKVHQQPVARTGGVAICIATIFVLYLVLLASSFLDLSISTEANFSILLVGSLCFFSIGLADDFLDLPASLRLVAQCAVGSMVWAEGLRIESLALPFFDPIQLGWLSLPITVIWLAGVVNAINWIDGLDGVAAGIGSIAAMSSFVICLQTGQLAIAPVCAALLGSLLGFLFFNFNPAQIFMGDGGSHFVGFLLAAVCVSGLDSQTTSMTVLLPLSILSVPLLDMIAVIVARLWQGDSPFVADNKHLHHRLLQLGLSHRFAVMVIYALSLWTATLALLSVGVPGSFFVVSFSTILLALAGQRILSFKRQEAFFS